uniref:Metalloendopeptidase n=1 Tax=Parastrongyloides trichosuri TaxID=131310 RepID=A0A0N4ZJS5_PARTI
IYFAEPLQSNDCPTNGLYKDGKEFYRKYPSNWTMPNIYYYVDNGLSNDAINKAMREISEKTCLRFHLIDNRSLDTSMEGLRFISGKGCATTLGKISSTTLHNISLGVNCSNNIPRIQTLIATALGLINQHNRPDRDNYISINMTDFDNRMKPFVCSRTSKFDDKQVNSYGIGYDYNSLMHWKTDVFRNNGTPTMQAKIPQYNQMMGQQNGLSFSDYKLLNTHFCSYLIRQGYCNFNCSNSGYCLYGTPDKCMCPNGFNGTRCEDLVKNSDGCSNSTQNITLSGEKLYFSENGIKNCTYLISVREGQRIQVNIKNVNTTGLKEKGKCAPEMGFEIKHRNDFSPAGLCLCGNHSSITFISDGNKIMILYRGNRTDDGFSLNLTTVENSDENTIKIKKENE